MCGSDRPYLRHLPVFPQAFHQFMVSLYAMQLFLIVLLSLKSFGAAPVMLPAMLITFIFHVTVYSLFRRPWSMLSVHDAAMLDNRDQASSCCHACHAAMLNNRDRASGAAMQLFWTNGTSPEGIVAVSCADNGRAILDFQNNEHVALHWIGCIAGSRGEEWGEGLAEAELE